MATTKLTHKLRNPKSYNKWMNIWTSHVEGASDYSIYPSSNWKIPINQLTANTVTEQNGDQVITENTETSLPDAIKVPMTNITGSTSNTLIKTDNNKNLVAGPAIDPNASAITFLNKQGNWVQPTINGTSPITVISPTNNSTIWTIEHSPANNTWLTDQDISLVLGNNTTGTTVFSFDKYGHIINKVEDIKIPTASNLTSGLSPAFGSNSAGKILKVDNNGTSASWVDPTTAISPVSASANGLAPKYGDNANGKILSVNSNNAPTWVDPTTTIPTVTINKNGLAPEFSANDTGKVLIVSNNGNSTSWTQLDIKDVPKYFYLAYNAWDINHERLSPDNVYNTNQNGGGCLSFIFTENEPPTASASDEESYYSEMYLSDTILRYL